MELRIQKARATKDIDLVLKTGGNQKTDKDEVHEKLLEATRVDANDFFEFQIHEPTLDLEAIPYGGLRFPIEANVDGRLFVRFPIDVVISSLVLDPVENLEHRDWLGFAGIDPLSYPTISKEQQFAEKLHAYTLPRDENKNSRVKDVVDMFLLIEAGEIDQGFMKQAIKEVFKYRGTHEVPNYLIEYPEGWIPKYERLRQECGIKENLDQCFFNIANFLKWPTVVSKEKQITVPNQAPCYFCGGDAQVWMSKLPKESEDETKELVDCDCKNCGPFRMSGLFAAMNNSEHNSQNWELWRDFLNKRNQKISDKRLLITSLNALPDFDFEN